MAEQFDTIAHKLNISANLIRKNSMYLGNLDGYLYKDDIWILKR